MRQIIAFIFFAACLLILSGMSLLTGKYYLSSFEGKVIDTETKAPIEGAAVLAIYYEEAFSPVDGSKLYVVDAQQAITGPDGQFKIPSKSGRADDYSGKLEGEIAIFKPGYGAFPDHILSKAVGENKSWPPPEKYIVYEIPKLKTREERIKNLLIFNYNGFPYEKTGRFVDLLNEERDNLGFSHISTPKKED